MAEALVLFGGTFDPVHNGHLIVARSVAAQRGFPRITFVPAASPPHKAGARAPADQRLEMLRLAIEGDPLFDVCEIELRRTGPSYTIDTLQELARLHGPGVRLYWMIGADMLETLPTWRSAPEVVDAAAILSMSRPPWDRRMDEVLRSLEGEFSPSQIRRLRDGVVETPRMDVSSTEIRRRVGLGVAIDHLVPAPVAKYIRDNGLYDPDSPELPPT